MVGVETFQGCASAVGAGGSVVQMRRRKRRPASDRAAGGNAGAFRGRRDVYDIAEPGDLDQR